MEQAITDQNRINELNLQVNQYLEWVQRFEGERKSDPHVHNCLRLKSVNRTLFTDDSPD